MAIFAFKSVLVMELRQLKYFVEVGRLGSVDNKADFRQSGFEKGASGRPFQR